MAFSAVRAFEIFIKAVCGKVSSSAAQTRDSNQSAKYQIQVKARKQEPPEGLSRLLDVLAATVQGQ